MPGRRVDAGVAPATVCEWLLVLHVLSAFALAGGIVALWAVTIASRSLPDDVMAALARPFGALTGAGAGLVLIFESGSRSPRPVPALGLVDPRLDRAVVRPPRLRAGRRKRGDVPRGGRRSRHGGAAATQRRPPPP